MGILSIVATPIGNLEDITLRALRTLREADAIFAEDTRVAAKLLARYEIKVPVHRLDAEVEIKVADEIIKRLEVGERIAYISDAGTPGISDPGTRLVARVRETFVGDAEELFFATRTKGGSAKNNSSASLENPPIARVAKDVSLVSPKFKIETIPGASALTAIISIAGVDMSQFTFLGFLPHKKGRQTRLKKIGISDIPVVLYESPHRIIKLLQELQEFAPDKHVVIGRELTKMHEELIAGKPEDLINSLESRDAVRGEFAVIVH